MISVSKSSISTAAKVFAVLFTVFGAIHIINYAFYGQALRNMVAGIAWSLMAYGIYKNGFEKVAIDKAARFASIAGAILFFVYVAMRYLA